VPRPITVGTQAIDGRTVAHILQARAAAAGYDADALGGNSFKRGAMTVGFGGCWHSGILLRALGK
jgi:hypothetical protein